MMEYLNKKVLAVNVAMLILLMGFSATVEASGSLSQSPSYNNISQFLGNGGDAITPQRRWRRRHRLPNYPEAFEKGDDRIIPESRRHRRSRFQILDASRSSTKKKDCCDSCLDIVYSIRFRCKDVWKSSCPSSCPASYCSCDQSHPPQCQCMLVAPDKCPMPTCS